MKVEYFLEEYCTYGGNTIGKLIVDLKRKKWEYSLFCKFYPKTHRSGKFKEIDDLDELFEEEDSWVKSRMSEEDFSRISYSLSKMMETYQIMSDYLGWIREEYPAIVTGTRSYRSLGDDGEMGEFTEPTSLKIDIERVKRPIHIRVLPTKNVKKVYLR